MTRLEEMIESDLRQNSYSANKKAGAGGLRFNRCWQRENWLVLPFRGRAAPWPTHWWPWIVNCQLNSTPRRSFELELNSGDRLSPKFNAMASIDADCWAGAGALHCIQFSVQISLWCQIQTLRKMSLVNSKRAWRRPIEPEWAPSSVVPT